MEGIYGNLKAGVKVMLSDVTGHAASGKDVHIMNADCGAEVSGSLERVLIVGNVAEMLQALSETAK